MWTSAIVSVLIVVVVHDSPDVLDSKKVPAAPIADTLQDRLTNIVKPNLYKTYTE